MLLNEIDEGDKENEKEEGNEEGSEEGNEERKEKEKKEGEKVGGEGEGGGGKGPPPPQPLFSLTKSLFEFSHLFYFFLSREMENCGLNGTIPLTYSDFESLYSSTFPLSPPIFYLSLPSPSSPSSSSLQFSSFPS